MYLDFVFLYLYPSTLVIVYEFGDTKAKIWADLSHSAL